MEIMNKTLYLSKYHLKQMLEQNNYNVLRGIQIKLNTGKYKLVNITIKRSD